MRNKIENEGYYHFLQRLAGNLQYGTSQFVNEDVLQRTLKLMFENALLSRGLRDVDIYREPELADAKRYDYLIKYGFIGPIAVEIKRLHNDEITNDKKRSDYKFKMQQYLNAVPGHNGVYLIVKVMPDEKGTDQKAYEKLVEEYQDIKGLQIIYLDCWKPIAHLLSIKISPSASSTPKKQSIKKTSKTSSRKSTSDHVNKKSRLLKVYKLLICKIVN